MAPTRDPFADFLFAYDEYLEGKRAYEDLPKLRAELRCATCSRAATCIGRYEDMIVDEPACSDCCGHSNEDGRCRPVNA